MVKNTAVFLFVVLLVPAISWAGLDVSGYVENQERVRIADVQEGSETEYPFDIMMADTWFDMTLKATGFEKKSKMLVDLNLRHFALEDESVDLSIREAWAGYSLKYFSFDLGKKIYSWGMADEMNPTDLICPEDLRLFYTYSKPERKIGVYSTDLTLKYKNFRLEGVWVPLFTSTTLPASNVDWTPWKLQLFYDLQEQFEEFIDSKDPHFPDKNIANSSGALRFSGVAGPVDFEAVAYDGWDHLPIYDIEIDTALDNLAAGDKPIVVRERYQRFNAYGGSVSGVIDPLTFRLEGAYYTERYFMHELDKDLLATDNLLTAYGILREMEDDPVRSKKSSFNIVGGFDYRYDPWFYINLQYFHMQILGYEDVLLDKEIENGISAKIEISLLDDLLKVGADTVYNVSHYDWMTNPKVSYLLTDSLKLEGGAVLFGGDPDTNFGEFDENDYAYTKLRFTF